MSETDSEILAKLALEASIDAERDNHEKPSFMSVVTHSPLVYNIWDSAGQERFGGLREGC
jgi:hypothetical protein